MGGPCPSVVCGWSVSVCDCFVVFVKVVHTSCVDCSVDQGPDCWGREGEGGGIMCGQKSIYKIYQFITQCKSVICCLLYTSDAADE